MRKILRTVVVGKGGAVEKAGNVIHLHFEGNWMPIKVWFQHLSALTVKAMKAGEGTL